MVPLGHTSSDHSSTRGKRRKDSKEKSFGPMKPTQITLESVDFFLRNVHARLPFRYGKATLTRMPLLHLCLKVRGENGETVEGYSADCLPPKWFDKTPTRSYRQNIEDLVATAQTASRIYIEESTGPSSVFELWWRGYQRCGVEGTAAGLNGLTTSFGSSLLERAAMDAACRLAQLPLRDWIASGGLGLSPETVHPELAGRTFTPSLTTSPGSLFLRQTVGMADPIVESDILDPDRVNDGLPQSLESWVNRSGVRYFKVKTNGQIDQDADRLGRIARLLDSKLGEAYQVSLDGNEVFSSLGVFEGWWKSISSVDALHPFLSRVLYIEQPFERSIALEESVCGGLHELENLPPVIIDESDGDLDSFKRAADLGYRGCSVKNCKGPIKAILNAMLIDQLNENGSGYFLTGEDLANLPVVPLQQDLALMDLLGITHAERNGHHYFRGLEHLSPRERDECLDRHKSLYEVHDGLAQLRIREGKIDVGSLRSEAYGACPRPDFETMIPLHSWAFESLGFDEES